MPLPQHPFPSNPHFLTKAMPRVLLSRASAIWGVQHPELQPSRALWSHLVQGNAYSLIGSIHTIGWTQRSGVLGVNLSDKLTDHFLIWSPSYPSFSAEPTK